MGYALKWTKTEFVWTLGAWMVMLYKTLYRFAATLQLIDEICYYAITSTDKRLESMSWSGFVSGILPKKAEIIECLKLKRLYINEPAEEREEM